MRFMAHGASHISLGLSFGRVYTDATTTEHGARQASWIGRYLGMTSLGRCTRLSWEGTHVSVT